MPHVPLLWQLIRKCYPRPGKLKLIYQRSSSRPHSQGAQGPNWTNLGLHMCYGKSSIDFICAMGRAALISRTVWWAPKLLCLATFAWLNKIVLLLSNGGTLQHFLWTPCFLKVYPTEIPISALYGGADCKIMGVGIHFCSCRSRNSIDKLVCAKCACIFVLYNWFVQIVLTNPSFLEIESFMTIS